MSHESVTQQLQDFVSRIARLKRTRQDDVRQQVFDDEVLRFLEKYFGQREARDFAATIRRPVASWDDPQEIRKEQLESAKKLLLTLRTRVERAEGTTLPMPPPDPVGLFDSLQLHPRIVEVARRLFVDGHYAQAIFEAFKALDNMVKDRSGLADLDGKQLMARAFDESGPILRLNRLRDRPDKDEQEGFKFLFMGSIVGIRNPKAHRTSVQRDALRTLEHLALASLLAKRVNEADKLGP